VIITNGDTLTPTLTFPALGTYTVEVQLTDDAGPTFLHSEYTYTIPAVVGPRYP